MLGFVFLNLLFLDGGEFWAGIVWFVWDWQFSRIFRLGIASCDCGVDWFVFRLRRFGIAGLGVGLVAVFWFVCWNECLTVGWFAVVGYFVILGWVCLLCCGFSCCVSLCWVFGFVSLLIVVLIYGLVWYKVFCDFGVLWVFACGRFWLGGFCVWLCFPIVLVRFGFVDCLVLIVDFGGYAVLVLGVTLDLCLVFVVLLLIIWLFVILWLFNVAGCILMCFCFWFGLELLLCCWFRFASYSLIIVLLYSFIFLIGFYLFVICVLLFVCYGLFLCCFFCLFVCWLLLYGYFGLVICGCCIAVALHLLGFDCYILLINWLGAWLRLRFYVAWVACVDMMGVMFDCLLVYWWFRLRLFVWWLLVEYVCYSLFVIWLLYL